MIDHMTSTQKGDAIVAFSLGGLGGSNAHGVGFLLAAQDKGLKPAMISCTSGQIHWTYNYIRGANLREELEKQIAGMPKFPEPFADYSVMKLAMNGMTGVFKPALTNSWLENLFKLPPTSIEELYNRLLPARSMIPTRDESFFVEIADTFNKTDIGIFFNSINPSTGIEYVHVNEAAREYLAKSYEQLTDTRTAVFIREGESAVFGVDIPRRLEAITPEYVKAALWLLPYGCDFKVKGESLFDGVYRRQMIIREMAIADVIFVVRPQGYSWQGALPSNYFQMEDLKTELMLNGSYAGELSHIELLNYLRDIGAISSVGYRHTAIYPIEVKTNRGYFDYFFDSMETCDDSLTIARQRIDEWRVTQ